MRLRNAPCGASGQVVVGGQIQQRPESTSTFAARPLFRCGGTLERIARSDCAAGRKGTHGRIRHHSVFRGCAALVPRHAPSVSSSVRRMMRDCHFASRISAHRGSGHAQPSRKPGRRFGVEILPPKSLVGFQCTSLACAALLSEGGALRRPSHSSASGLRAMGSPQSVVNGGIWPGASRGALAAS